MIKQNGGYKMSKKKIDIEGFLKKIGFSPTIFDRIRMQELESLKTAQQTKMEAYKIERERLAAKYGIDHSRVKKLDDRLKYNEGIIKGLDIEIESAGIKFPDFDKSTSWMVCGRVFNKELKGIKGLTVSLYDNQGKWINQMGYTGTDERGYYSLIYPAEKIKKNQTKEDQELFLTVSDKQNHILHRESEPLFVKIGQIDTRMIVITDQVGTSPPPGPDQGKPGPGQDQTEQEQKQKQTGSTQDKEQWIVEGAVKDEKNKPIKGIKVNLYDTEHRFDDRLGSKVTDKNGKFKFTFKGEDFQALKEAKADIHLEVVDDKDEAVYTSPEPVRCKPGGVDTFDILIPTKTNKTQKK
jgi:hypothetical protein